MSAWDKVFAYLGAMKKSETITGRIPLLDIGIGSVVDLPKAHLTKLKLRGALLANIPETSQVICAVSRVKFPGMDTQRCYRAYLEKGDADDEKERFLQFVISGNESNLSLKEIMYCERVARIYPATEQDQDFYTGSSGEGLGQYEFTLSANDLASLGFDNAKDLIYTRNTGSASSFASPLRGGETRMDDQKGDIGLSQELYFMPYAREIFEGQEEHLLITTEVVESVNGDASKREIHVDFMVGFALEQERLKFY